MPHSSEMGGECVYCHYDLFKSYDTASATDHLIPKSRLKQDGRLNLMWDIRNLVASCAECNAIKRDFDPVQGASLYESLIKKKGKR